jgi:RHS repeat-associated protein
LTNWNAAAAGDYYYGYTASGDTPDFVRDVNWTVSEKNLELPGSVIVTIKPQETVAANKAIYNLPNNHGDTLLTTNANGTNTSTGNGPLNSFTYDPFGGVLAGSVLPANTDHASYGWVGQHEKLTESEYTTTPIQMGARVYIPGIGRFLQVDPIEGGTENNYVYPVDAVNEFDLSGNTAQSIAAPTDAGGHYCAVSGFSQCLKYLEKVAGVSSLALPGVGNGSGLVKATAVIKSVRLPAVMKGGIIFKSNL